MSFHIDFKCLIEKRTLTPLSLNYGRSIASDVWIPVLIKLRSGAV
jgi:hypothetical protein